MTEAQLALYCLGVAGAALAVAITSLVMQFRGRREVPITSKLRREIRLGWQRLLPHISVDTEHLLLRGESAHNNRAALLSSLGVDVEIAEQEGVRREEISYLALVCSTLMVRSSKGKLALTDNFLEHRLLRRLFEKSRLRRAWRFARKIAPPDSREQIDAYLLHNYPREKWLLGLDEGEPGDDLEHGDVTWGKGVVLFSRELEDGEGEDGQEHELGHADLLVPAEEEPVDAELEDRHLPSMGEWLAERDMEAKKSSDGKNSKKPTGSKDQAS